MIEEYLVRVEAVRSEDDPTPVQDLADRQRQRLRELEAAGYLCRLWQSAELAEEVGIWRANSEGELRQALESLPMRPYVSFKIDRLRPHRNDPARPERWLD